MLRALEDVLGCCVVALWTICAQLLNRTTGFAATAAAAISALLCGHCCIQQLAHEMIKRVRLRLMMLWGSLLLPAQLVVC